MGDEPQKLLLCFIVLRVGPVHERVDVGSHILLHHNVFQRIPLNALHGLTEHLLKLLLFFGVLAVKRVSVGDLNFKGVL